MALEINIAESSIGVPFPTAYARIFDVQGDKESLRVNVDIFATEEARQANAQPIGRESFHIGVAELSGDLFPALYGWIKETPQFAGAEDA